MQYVATDEVMLGGWQSNAIVTLEPGESFNVNLGLDQANVGLSRGNTQRPNWIHTPSAHCSLKDYIRNNRYNNGGASCSDATAYAIPPVGTCGKTGRNALNGPGCSNVTVATCGLVHERDSRPPR